MELFQGLLSLIKETTTAATTTSLTIAPATSTTNTIHKRGKNKNRKRNKGGKKSREKQAINQLKNLSVSAETQSNPRPQSPSCKSLPTTLPPPSLTPPTCSTFISQPPPPQSVTSPTPSTPSTLIQQTQALDTAESPTRQAYLDHSVKLMVLPDEVEKETPFVLKKVESCLPERCLWFMDTKDPRYYVYSGIEDPKPRQLGQNRSTGSGMTPPPDIPLTPIIIPLERMIPSEESPSVDIPESTEAESVEHPPSPYIPTALPDPLSINTSYQQIPSKIPTGLNPYITLEQLTYIPTPIKNLPTEKHKLKNSENKEEAEEAVDTEKNPPKTSGKGKERKQHGLLGTKEDEKRWMEVMNERKMRVKKIFFEEKGKGKIGLIKEAETKDAKNQKERLKERRRMLLKAIAKEPRMERQEKGSRGLKNEQEDREKRRTKEELRKKRRLDQQITKLKIRKERTEREMGNKKTKEQKGRDGRKEDREY